MKYLVIIFLVIAPSFAKLAVPIENNGDVKITDVIPNVAVRADGTKVIVKGSGFSNDSKVLITPIISDSSAILSSTKNGSWTTRAKIEGDIAYVLNIESNENFLSIFDISDKSSPEFLSSISVESAYSKITVANGIVYLANKIIDCNNPLLPFIIATLPVDNVSHIAIDGNIGYVTNGTSEISLVDLSDLKEPKFIKSIDLNNSDADADAITIQDNIAYVSAQSGGLILIDISDMDKIGETAPICQDKLFTNFISH